MAANKLAKRYQTSAFSASKPLHCRMCEATRGKQTLIFVKPKTYMNLSGKSALAVQSHYNVSLDNIIVIHDDVYLEVGRVKVKTGGHHAGHNGLKSIDEAIGNGYHRVRIGVGEARDGLPLADHVLENFPQAEHEIVQQAIGRIASNFDLLLDRKWDLFRNKMVANMTNVSKSEAHESKTTRNISVY